MPWCSNFSESFLLCLGENELQLTLGVIPRQMSQKEWMELPQFQKVKENSFYPKEVIWSLCALSNLFKNLRDVSFSWWAQVYLYRLQQQQISVELSFVSGHQLACNICFCCWGCSGEGIESNAPCLAITKLERELLRLAYDESFIS